MTTILNFAENCEIKLSRNMATSNSRKCLESVSKTLCNKAASLLSLIYHMTVFGGKISNLRSGAIFVSLGGSLRLVNPFPSDPVRINKSDAKSSA